MVFLFETLQFCWEPSDGSSRLVDCQWRFFLNETIKISSLGKEGWQLEIRNSSLFAVLFWFHLLLGSSVPDCSVAYLIRGVSLTSGLKASFTTSQGRYHHWAFAWGENSSLCVRVIWSWNILYMLCEKKLLDALVVLDSSSCIRGRGQMSTLFLPNKYERNHSNSWSLLDLIMFVAEIF